MSKDQLFGERYCMNCNELLAEEALYCHLCSQKCTDGRITVKELLKEFFDSVFNIDSKFFRTVGALVIPGKLTIEYFLGRHKSYSHPIRLFLVSGILFFFLASMITIRYAEKGLGKAEDSMLKLGAYEAKVLSQVDSFKLAVLDSFENNPILIEAFDSLDVKIQSWQDDDSLDIEYFEYYPLFGVENRSIKLSKVDAIEMDSGELAKAYKFDNNYIGQIIVTQAIRVQTNLVELVTTAISQSIWSFLFMMLALGLILKLLYIRRGIFYIEHLIFSFHFHAFGFIVGSILLLIGLMFPGLVESSFMNGLNIIFLGTLIYMLIAMKRVYQQNWFKTFIKFCILNFSYLFVFILFITISALVTFLVF